MAHMKSKTLVEKAVDIAKNYKTLYVMGCFGSPMTAANKKTLPFPPLTYLRKGILFCHISMEIFICCSAVL